MNRWLVVACLAAVAAFSYMRAPWAAPHPDPKRLTAAEWAWKNYGRWRASERVRAVLGAEVRRLRRVAARRPLQAVRGSDYALRLAASTFRVSEAEMVAVARCETADFTDFYNEGSGASGLMQFLPSTWAREGIDGFDVFDPVANALAAARIVAREGWAQWSCRP